MKSIFGVLILGIILLISSSSTLHAGWLNDSIKKSGEVIKKNKRRLRSKQNKMERNNKSKI